MSDIRETFAKRYADFLSPLAVRLEEHLVDLFRGYPRIDRITARAKAVDSFVAKAERKDNGNLKYDDPLNQIQDQLGARIIAFYKSDAEKIAQEVPKYFRHIESRKIVPDSEKEFGYEGIHFILFVPMELYDEQQPVIEFFELQVKTLFQHAWSEADHNLGYKPFAPLSRDQKRRLAFTAAQAWGADHVFDELCRQTVGGSGRFSGPSD